MPAHGLEFLFQYFRVLGSPLCSFPMFPWGEIVEFGSFEFESQGTSLNFRSKPTTSLCMRWEILIRLNAKNMLQFLILLISAHDHIKSKGPVWKSHGICPYPERPNAWQCWTTFCFLIPQKELYFPSVNPFKLKNCVEKWANHPQFRDPSFDKSARSKMIHFRHELWLHVKRGLYLFCSDICGFYHGGICSIYPDSNHCTVPTFPSVWVSTTPGSQTISL